MLSHWLGSRREDNIAITLYASLVQQGAPCLVLQNMWA